MIKFYIYCLIINFGIIWLSFEFIEYLLSVICAGNYLLMKLSVISEVWVVYFYYKVLFFLLSPLTILFVKEYKTHFIIFLITNLVLALLYFLLNYDRLIWERLTYEIVYFMFSGTVISSFVYVSQKIIGLKVLPIMYKT